MRRFSLTASSGNTSVIWKVRAMPRHTRRAGNSAEISSPSKMMRPELCFRKPLMVLKNVVLPAPLGPMIARNSPGSTVIEILLTATRLPKSLETFSTFNRLMT